MNNIPDFQKLMYPLLRTLADDKPHQLAEVLDAIAKEFKITEDELRIKVPSGQQPLLKNRLTWAISHLKNAGLLYYPQRGNYRITEAGKKVLSDGVPNINLAFLKKLDAYKNWQSTFSEPGEIKVSTEKVEEQTPEEIIGDTVKTINARVGSDLLDILKTKPPAFFEKFVLMLLSKMGYGGTEEYNFEVVGKSGDNGIDGIIYQDQFGIDRVYVQAKRWSDIKVQSKDIRDFIGSLSLKGTNKGIFITTSSFTEDAYKTVLMNPQNRIILINGQQLTEYAIKFNVGVQVKTEYQVKNLDNDFFEEL